MQMNPMMMQLMQMIRGGGNPQQLVMNMLEQQMSGNPMGQNLLALAKNGDGAGIEKIARNLAQSQGIDFDKEFASFRQMMGL